MQLAVLLIRCCSFFTVLAKKSLPASWHSLEPSTPVMVPSVTYNLHHILSTHSYHLIISTRSLVNPNPFSPSAINERTISLSSVYVRTVDPPVPTLLCLSER